MNIGSFFDRGELNILQKLIKQQEIFSMEKTVQEKENKYTLHLSSSFVADDLAHDIWHDNNYLIHFNVDYHGKLGTGGSGFATCDLSVFRDWDAFKEWIDHQMRRFYEYEVDYSEQMSLF